MVEQLLLSLAGRDDIELTTVAVCSQNPLEEVTEALAYFAANKELDHCRFDPALNGLLSGRYIHHFGAQRAFFNNKIQQLVMRAIRRLEQPKAFLQPGRYDIFHSPFFPLPPRTLSGAAQRIQTIYDLIPLKRPDWMPDQNNRLGQSIISGVDPERDWVICISEFTREEFCDFTGMAPERVFVAPLAAAQHFKPVKDRELIDKVRNKYGIPAGDYFLSLGALQPRKNFGHLIDAFQQLLKQQTNADVNLVIVGEKHWMYNQIFSSVQNFNHLRNQITLTGFVDEQDLSALYSDAKAFIFVSLYEGFGLPALEAMQCGTPVIVSSTTALPEVVGDAGLLVDPHDTDALCDAMLALLQNERQALELKRKGLLRSAEFSWSLCAEKTIQAYRAAMLSS